MWKKQCDLVLTGAKEASSDWNDSFLRAIDTASGKKSELRRPLANQQSSVF